MAAEPLNKLKLQASSAAQDVGFVALFDLCEILKETGLEEKSVVIGGHMMGLHVERWGLSMPRLTKDSDLGTWKPSFYDDAIIEQLKARGYEAIRSNRYGKEVTDLPIETKDSHEEYEALIDLLVPASKTRARKNIKAGVITTIEVPGLAEALTRPVVAFDLEMTRLNGETLFTRISIPDEASALVLKALAWRERNADKDAVDIWRGLELCFISGVSATDFEVGEMKAAVEVIVSAFGKRQSLAMTKLAQHENLTGDLRDQRYTRIKALIKRVLDRKI